MGNPYTWRNKRVGLAHIKQRLDRALANTMWRIAFPRAGFIHLPTSNSDHNPIILKIWTENVSRSKPFRFEAMWIRDEESREIVKKAWTEKSEGSKQYKFSTKIKNTKEELKRWNRNTFCSSD